MVKRGKMKGRSQAFNDFLMAYGWVIMVFLMGIAALDYFGVIDLTSVFPEKCILDYKVSCMDYEINPSETKIVIANEAKRPIIVESIDVAGCSGSFSAEMRIGETSAFTLTGCNNGKKGKTVKGEILLEYAEKKTGLQRAVHGKIKSKVRE